MKPEYVDWAAKKVIKEIFADCIFHAEQVIDRMAYDHFSGDAEYVKKMITHNMSAGVAHIVAQKLPKLEMEKTELYVKLSSNIIVFTEKELDSFVTILSNMICEEEKNGNK